MDKNELLKLIATFSQNNAQKNKQNADKLISNLNSSQKSELNSIINNQQKVNEILNSPVAQKIINNLNGNKDGQH